MFYCLNNQNIFISFLISLVFGIVSTIVFLYLFIHQSSSKFVRKLKQVEENNEKKYLKNFLHFGKFLACTLISLIGGPIFLALTVKFLFPHSPHKYRIAIAVSIISNIIFVSFSKGLLRIVFKI
jgi:predicted permease